MRQITMSNRDELGRRWQETEQKIRRLYSHGLQGSPEDALLLQEQDAIEYDLGLLDFEGRAET
jgi:hypothetical protein